MPSGIWHLEPRRIRLWYERGITATLDHPTIAAYLSLNRHEVTEEHLREALDRPPLIAEVLRSSSGYRELRARAARRDAHRQRFTETRDLCHATPFLPLLLAVGCLHWLLGLIIELPWWVSALLLIWPIGYFSVTEFRNEENRDNFISQLQTAIYFAIWVPGAADAEIRLWWWSFNKLPRTMDPIMRREIAALLGPDHESLLVARSHDGLIDASNPQYWVSTKVERTLKRKLDQMGGGAIAICGPRGVGKSTLLKKACQGRLDHVRQFHFDVVVQTPANYRPEEFLLSLFQAVCRGYLELYGRRPRTPFLFRSRSRAANRPRRLYYSARRWAQLLLGILLVGVAIQDEVRNLAMGIYQSSYPASVNWASESWRWALKAWHEHAVVAHIVLIAAGSALIVWTNPKEWIKGHPFRRLVHDCHNYLNLLQHIQTISSTTSLGGAANAFNLTFGRTSGSTSRTFTYPELVSEFRSLLSRISEAEREDNCKVFIGIDELDRLGSTEQARTFLSEIKAIFDIPRVYFVLSVSEDIGAAFIRRGLPTRDVTDSSLEDVLPIEARTLNESGILLQTRVPGFTDPFVALVHALSGGIPRDLIRYTRKVTETHRRTDQHSLSALSRDLLWEEAAQALSGFRVLLANHSDSARWAETVHSLHNTITMIRGADSRRPNHELERRLLALAQEDEPPPPNGSEPASELSHRWEELSCYALFIVTLLEVFARRDFAARRAAYTGPEKEQADLQRLADARLEMSISPHSARKIIERFRAHWALRSAARPVIPQQPEPNGRNARTQVNDGT
ncbi:P-loop NTPase fold protein [Streptomyces nigrescens]|uniref:P-loop NTPase fold protein n=1 Tax=Streptomyces nigrescens TaxID=1920 RepID=UPI0036D06176